MDGTTIWHQADRTSTSYCSSSAAWCHAWMCRAHAFAAFVSSRAANGLCAVVQFSLKHILLLAIAGGR